MSDADEIAARSFATARKGFDPDEVREFLTSLAQTQRLLQAKVSDDEATIAALRSDLAAASARVAALEAEVTSGLADASARAEDALAEATATKERIEAEAHREAERLVAEAEGARTRVLRDLRRRRKKARTQVEQLSAARERLLAAMSDVRRQADLAIADLRDALPEARSAADAAARRVENEDEVTVEQLESEIEALRLAGLSLAGPPPSGEVPVVAAAEAVAAAPAVERRASEAVRIVRPWRPQVETLQPIDAPDPDETVRLVTMEDLEVAAPDDVPAEVVAEQPVAPERSEPEPEPVIEEPDVPVEVVAEQPVAPERSEPEPEPVVEEPDVSVEVVAEQPVAPERLEPEPEPVVEEPDVPVEVVAEQPVAPERPAAPEVDALFARLKAGRADRVAAAEAVLERTEPEPVEPEVVEAEVFEAEVFEAEDVQVEVVEVEVEVDEVVVHLGGGASRTDLLARRDEAIAPAVAALARRVKRLLADDQNEVLDGLRRRGTGDALGDAEHRDARHARWAAETSVDLAVAAAAGITYLNGSAAPGTDPTPGDLVVVAESFAEQFVGSLHHRLTQVLETNEDDAEGAGDVVRSVYRTWRNERLAPAVTDAVLDAFAAGIADRCDPGTPVCWVVDFGGVPCPDAEDNALAGGVGCGQAFPTGHARPPAHPGCRCVLVPVSATTVTTTATNAGG